MAPFPPFREQAKVEPELELPAPRRVALRPLAALACVYNGVINGFLMFIGFGALVSFVLKSPFKWQPFAWALLPALLFGFPSLLRLILFGASLKIERALIANGRLVRVEIESIETTTGKNARQTLTLCWPPSGPFNEIRREQVEWSGFVLPLPEQKPRCEQGQVVSVLEDAQDARRFVVYELCSYHAL